MNRILSLCIFALLAYSYGDVQGYYRMYGCEVAPPCTRKTNYPKPKRARKGVDMGSLTNLMWSKHSNMNPYVNALPTSGDTSYLYLD
jgi:hypothetical protein